MMKELVCICCPSGCRIRVEMEGNRILELEGNRCRKGYEYAAQEAVAPMRVLTGLMRAEGCEKPFAVRSDRTIPKELMLQCAAEMKHYRPRMPVRIGDVMIRDIFGTGANIIAAQDFPADS